MGFWIHGFLVSVLGATPNHIPLQYRCPTNLSDRIGHLYLRIWRPLYWIQSIALQGGSGVFSSSNRGRFSSEKSGTNAKGELCQRNKFSVFFFLSLRQIYTLNKSTHDFKCQTCTFSNFHRKNNTTSLLTCPSTEQTSRVVQALLASQDSSVQILIVIPLIPKCLV